MTGAAWAATAPLLQGALVPLAVLAVDYVGVTAAVAADLCSGVARSRREGRLLTSRGYRRTVDKLGIYLRVLAGLTTVDAMVMAAVTCARLTGGPQWPLVPALTTLGAVGVVLVEVKSIAENSGRRATFRSAVDLLRRVAGSAVGRRLLP